ncbi:MAG: sensor histidine kinase [Acidobacteriota bacterium]
MRVFPRDPDLGWTPWAWLVYLGIFLLPVFFTSLSTTVWVLMGLTVVVFLALYIGGYWLQHLNRWRAVYAVAAALVVLALVWAPYNTGANVFMVYAGAFLGCYPKARRALLSIFGLVGIVALAYLALDLSLFFALPALIFTVLIGGLNIHFSEVGRKNEALRKSRAEVERLAQVAERERIARDLHDLLGHTLSLITLKSELAAKLAERDTRRAAQEIRDVEAIARKALAEVRAAVTGYRAGGLTEEIDNARQALDAAGVLLEADIDDLNISPRDDGILALILREAVTNVVRHARAHACEICLSRSGDHVQLLVADDGIGSDAPEGAGLRGMRERVEAIGGRMDLTTAPSQGTKILVSVERPEAVVAELATDTESVLGETTPVVGRPITA